MNRKIFRIIIGLIWIVVAVLTYTRNDIPFAILSAVLGIIFFVYAFRDNNANTNR